MKRLDVFATKEEIEILKEEFIGAKETPIMAFTCEHMMRGGFAGDAWQRLKEHCHKIALNHGLPEVEGFYGCDLETGEFVVAD